MNPSYPLNGNPYPSSPSPFHQPPAAPSPVSAHSPQIPQGMSSHATHYPYTVAHTYHGYPSYPQYPSAGIVMYGAPPTGHPDAARAPAASPTPVAPSIGKRKRKSTVDDPYGRTSNEEDADSTGDLSRPPAQSSTSSVVVDTKKRTKTQRACDSCRSRKIRCDVLADADPPICQHCKQYGFECTFFLPITETRFKKKKLEEEAAAAAAEKDKEGERSTSSPQTDNKGAEVVKVYGPTSAAHLLHSQAMIPSRAYESYDMRYHHSWDVSSGGNGVIRIHEPQQGELQLALPKPIDMRIERDVVERLVNAYFADVAPLLPVVTREEFVESSPPPPLLLYSICLVAAASRDVPQAVYDSLRYAVNSLIKAEDVLSTASIINVQALLILAMCGDCHSQFVPNALSALWLRLGCAIRMAQDLGLHRAESVKQNIELRRRLWGICVISDRWISLTYGHPFMIDVQDCDARLPSSGDPHDRYLDELVRLSVIVGRVLKTIYTPAGLHAATDEQLYTLLRDIEAWKNNLPEDLQFQGPETPRTPGLLFMLYACVNMLFWRVFMRISYACPQHLKFALTVEKWTELVQLTGQAIDWLDANERLYDVWLLVAYCATSCALVQYHTWARRKDPEAQLKLKKLRDCIRKWEASLSPDHMSARRKAQIIALLYEATLGPQHSAEPPVLNPTGGVKGKPSLNGLSFRKDPTRPGGGVFVAETKPQDDQVAGVPPGTIIGRDDEGRQGEGIAIAVSDVRARNDRGPSSVPSASSPYHAWSSSAVGPRQEPPSMHRQQQSASMMDPMSLGVGFPSNANMNPMLNHTPPSGNVQVLNALDAQQPNALEQLASAENFLDLIPDGIGIYGYQWDEFVSRFAPQVSQFQHIQGVDMGMQSSTSQASPQYPYNASSNSGM
ncbi:uncharacterized protein FIBRA_08487 [Fibroporia radiculosa]|uniref:Zn(2)-C6 fungal-type domain-containing protein n=1 Tax=Fibroporia radiculosa TaxID=599839 RepID=J4H573_9APHY|nr:uncharacterized protein FIBRA_08487 [Fibroporia radiculosa]CCM06239.1 predicted protein [Fibroporia radiculosa]